VCIQTFLSGLVAETDKEKESGTPS